MPPRNKLFLQKNSTYPIHANRYANTDMYHVLGVHLDIQNPNIHDSLDDLFMNQSVGCFAKKRGQIRKLLIGFGRESVVNTAIRYGKILPCIKRMTVLYNKLTGDKFDIVTTLVEILNSKVKEKGYIHHFPNNLNK